MIDPRIQPQQLLRVGSMLALNGDSANAVRAYREVVLAGEPKSAAEAIRRIDELERNPSAL